MSQSFSAYLHFLRLFSALIVFVHHASYDRFDGFWLQPLGRFGHEAVMVFFVLSGFVIAFITDTAEKNARAYWSARMSRLASVALPAIALTYCFDLLGASLHAPTYANLGSGSFWDISAFFYLNQIWLLSAEPGSNIPYWSLSYEFCFYLLFGLFVFARRPLVYCSLAALLIGPKILLLFPAWWFGIYAYRQTLKPIRRGRALFFAIFGALFAMSLSLTKFGNVYINWRWKAWLSPEAYAFIGRSDSFVGDIAIAAGIAMHFVGMSALLKYRSIPSYLYQKIKQSADATFTIYLMHYPALYFFTALSMFFWSEKYGVFIGFSSLLVGVLSVHPTEKFRRYLRRLFLERRSLDVFEEGISKPGKATMGVK